MSSKPAHHDGGWSCFLSNRFAPFCHTNKFEEGEGVVSLQCLPRTGTLEKRFFFLSFFSQPLQGFPTPSWPVRGLTELSRVVRAGRVPAD